MGIYLGSSQIDNINIINISSINTDIEDALVNRRITSYNNNEISSIRTGAFVYCYYLASVSLPQAITIGSNAFYSCNSLTSINLPQVTSIGNNAFRTCSSLTSVNLPRVTSIGSYAFYTCSSLTSVNLPQATTIGSYAFAYCYSLTSVNLPQATTIGGSAFLSCRSLTSVSLPQVTTISRYAFYNCYNLLSLYLLGSSVPILSSGDAFTYTPISTYTTSTGGVYGSIYVPASLYNSYIAATNWSIYSSRIVSTNIVYNGSYEVYHISGTANNVNYVDVPDVTTISPDTLYIEINGIKYECSKQDVSSDYEEPAYAYGYYGDTTQWSSDDYPFGFVFLNSMNDSLCILSSVAEAGDYISLTVFYI